MNRLISFAICILVLFSIKINAQPSEGGTPYSFKHKEFQKHYSSITMEKPNMEQVMLEDAESNIFCFSFFL